METAKRIRDRAGYGAGDGKDTPSRSSLSALKVLILVGGDATERVVSQASGIAAAQALVSRGHQVQLLDPATWIRVEAGPESDPAELSRALGMKSSRAALVREDVPPEEARRRGRAIVPALSSLADGSVDVVFNLLHGGAGEGGVVSGVLDLLRVPYVGSEVGSSAVAMDKAHAKSVLGEFGIPIAPHFLWDPTGTESRPEVVRGTPGDEDIAKLGGYPVVVKPMAEGSTVGITIVRSPDDWEAARRTSSPYAHPTRGLMVERFVPGRELTVGVVGEDVLPVVEIVPGEGFYDFERKYTSGASQYICPADISAGESKRIQDYALSAFQALGCRDYARVDFRLADDGELACLEVNTVPGMTATSLLPMGAKAVGIDFGELLEILCRIALSRAAGERKD